MVPSSFRTLLLATAALGSYEACLRGSASGTDLWKMLCRSKECIVEMHKSETNGEFIPGDMMTRASGEKKKRGKKFGNLLDQDVGTRVQEFICDGTNDDEAIRLVNEGIEKSWPVLFKGCAREMTAITKWTKDYLLKQAPDRFGNLFRPGFAEGGFFPCPENMVQDLYPKENTGFVDFIKKFRQKNYVWTSKGARIANTHLGTFDNLHVSISEKKLFWLASPKYAPHFYIDFIDDDCPGDGLGDYGCDHFGCYQFLPYKEEGRINLHKYPKIQDIVLNATVISPGDVLLVPAFWFHHVEHLPREPVGKNIAIAFVHQRKDLPKSPFSYDIVDFWRAHVEGKVKLHRDSCESWSDTCPWEG